MWVQANAFRRYNFQMIDRVKDSLTAPWMPINLQSLYVQGWDITWRYDLPLMKIIPAAGRSVLSFMSSYAVLNSHRLDTQNLNAYSQFTVSLLPKQWISSVVYQNGRLQVGLYHRMVQRAGLANSISPTYHLWDGRLNYNFGLKETENKNTVGKVGEGVKKSKPFTVWLQVQNMMGIEYRDFAAIPLLPRWITIGGQLQF